MNNTNGSLDFRARINIESLQADMGRLRNEFTSMTSTAKAEGQKTQSTINNLLKGAGAIFTIGAAKQFVGKIVEIRGAFQQLEVSFETMLGSKEKSIRMMDDVVKFAAKTPFTLQEVAGGTKQLLAFNVAQNKVIPTLKAMGDVSAGLNVPIGRLIANFGQVKMAGKLKGRELKDFVMAGVPLIDELAKNMGKNKIEISSMVSAGQIGFKDVENAFTSMSSAGGKFADLMDKQSGTITGQISNLEDAVDKMFNDIGKSSEGVIGGMIEGAGYLVENYKEVWEIIKNMIVIYGAYRAALIVSSVATSVATQSTAGYTVAQQINYQATLAVEGASKKLNRTLLANPYAIIAMAVMAVVYASYKLVTSTTEAEKATERLKNTSKEFTESSRKEELAVEDLFAELKSLTKGTEEYEVVKSKIINQYGSYLKGMSDEVKSLKDIEGAYDAIIGKIKAKYREQARSKAMEDETNVYISTEQENLRSIKKIISRGVKDKVMAKKMFNELKAISQSDKNTLNGLSRGVGGVGNTFHKLEGSGNIQQYIRNIQRATKTLKKRKEDIDSLLSNDFGNAKIYKNADGSEKTKSEKLIIRKKLLKDLANIEKKIYNIRKDGIVGEKEDKSLIKSLALKKEIESKLKVKFDYKASKNGRGRAKQKNEFDLVAYKKKQKREIEDLEYKNLLKSLKAEKVGYNLSLELAKVEGERKITMLNRLKEDKLLYIDENEIKSKKAGKNINSKEQKKEFIKINDIAIKQQEDANNNLVEKLQKDHLKKLLGGLKTYKKKRSDLLMKRDLTDYELKNNGASKEDRNLLINKANKELSILDDASKEHGALINAFYNDTANETIETLNKMISDGDVLVKQLTEKTKFENLKSNPFKLTKEQYNEMLNNKGENKVLKNLEAIKNKALSMLNPFKKLSESLKILQNPKSSKSDIKIAFKHMGDGLQEVSSYANDLSGILKSVGDITGNDMFGDMGESISKVADIAMNVGGALAKGDYVGAAIAGVTGVLKMASDAQKKHRESLAKIRESEYQQQQAYNKALFEQNLLYKEATTIFGTDKISKVTRYIDLMNKTSVKLKDAFAKKEEDVIVKTPYSNIKVGTHNVSKLDKIQTKTGHEKTGLFGWGKGRDTYSSLTGQYKDLINKEGELNLVRAKSIISSGELNKENARSLQEIINLQEQSNEAKESLNDYLKSTYGELGSSMLDDIVNSLTNGIDAFESFEKSVSNVLRNVGKEMINNLFMQEHYKTLQQDLKDIQNARSGIDVKSLTTKKEVEANVAYLTSKAIKKYKANMTGAMDEIKDFKENVSGFGFFENTEEDKRESKAKKSSLSQMSQETGTALDGKFTLSIELQRRTLEVNKDFVNSLNLLKLNNSKQLDNLIEIKNNTKHLIEIKEAITNINDKGIDLKR